MFYLNAAVKPRKNKAVKDEQSSPARGGSRKLGACCHAHWIMSRGCWRARVAIGLIGKGVRVLWG